MPNHSDADPSPTGTAQIGVSIARNQKLEWAPWASSFPLVRSHCWGRSASTERCWKRLRPAAGPQSPSRALGSASSRPPDRLLLYIPPLRRTFARLAVCLCPVKQGPLQEERSRVRMGADHGGTGERRNRHTLKAEGAGRQFVPTRPLLSTIL